MRGEKTMKLFYGVPEDIENWMRLVTKVRGNFPGLETQEALKHLDRTKEVTVSTFRAEDEKGAAPRSLYEKYGFVPAELIEEFGYPNQKYVLYPAGAEEGTGSLPSKRW